MLASMMPRLDLRLTSSHKRFEHFLRIDPEFFDQLEIRWITVAEVNANNIVLCAYQRDAGIP